ncbi:hypothetical protein PGTUg99_015832 [Puccinia graminis f. sp. tritici]|uniref:Uncharacterized protein n=1 Tax=Puccinia graminis f. sp. tritici TaxID=56615 RepID=A0A5B0RWJ4_PUCGR|nr:hypothetical protein PGTUg99_015832 [Puccinia graminis f. sp. tritici]
MPISIIKHEGRVLSVSLLLISVLVVFPWASIAPNPHPGGLFQRSFLEEPKPAKLPAKVDPPSIASRQAPFDPTKKLTKSIGKPAGSNSTSNVFSPISITNQFGGNGPPNNGNNPFSPNNNSPDSKNSFNGNNPSNGFSNPLTANNPANGLNNPLTANNPLSGINNPLNSKNSQLNTNNPANSASTASGPQCGFHQSMSPVNNTVKKTDQNGIKPEDCYDALAQILEDRNGRTMVRVNATEKRQVCGTCRLKFETNSTGKELQASLEVVMFGTDKQRNGGMNVLLSSCGQRGGQIIMPAGTNLKSPLRIDIAKSQVARICTPRAIANSDSPLPSISTPPASTVNTFNTSAAKKSARS